MSAARPLSSAILIIVLCIHVLPTAFLIVAGVFGSPVIATWDAPSIQSFRAIAQDPSARSALMQSISLGVTSSTLAVAVTFVFIGGARAEAVSQDTRESGLAFLPVSFPDIVWGLGFLILIRWGMIQAGMKLVFLVHLTFNLALAYLIVKPAVRGVPSERVEAADDLGASHFHILSHVILPAVLPSLIAASILCFVFSFDDFVLTFLLGGTEVQTVPLFIYGKLKFGAAPEVVGLASLAAIVGVVGVALTWAVAGRSAADLSA